MRGPQPPAGDPGGVPELAALTSAEAADAAGSVVLIPIGAVEQHGPHLPLGTDSWLAQRVALGAAARSAGVLVGAAVPVGCSAHHRAFPGTLSLRPATFIAMLTDIARSLAADRFIPVFVNGHGGNRAPLATALHELLADGIEAWGVSYFDLIRIEVQQAFPDPGTIGHACAMETSLSLALWPQLVREQRIPGRSGTDSFPDPSLFPSDPVLRPVPFERLSLEGVVGDPAIASTATGEELFDAAVERLAALCEQIKKAGAAPPATDKEREPT